MSSGPLPFPVNEPSNMQPPDAFAPPDLSEDEEEFNQQAADDEPQSGSPATAKNPNFADSQKESEEERYDQRSVEMLLKTMSSLSVDISDFESAVFPEDRGFTPLPSEVQISQQLDTLNRRIDAEFQTDVFRVKGHVSLHQDEAEPFTRMFEPIGDWIPNILIGDSERGNVFIKPTFRVVKKTTSEFHIAKSETRTPRMYERYLTLNGKTIFMKKLSVNAVLPVFLNFRGCDEYDGADLRAVRVGATHEEIYKECHVIDHPINTMQLFADAVDRGRRAKRAVNQLQLFPYVRPSLDRIGYTQDAKDYLNNTWAEVSNLAELSEMTYKEILLDLVSEFKRKLQLEQPTKEGESLFQLWEAMTKSIGDSLTEEEARSVYMTMLDSLSGGKYNTDNVLIPTGRYMRPVGNVDEDVLTLALEVHMDGKPYYVHAKCSGTFPIIQPYSLVPDHCDAPLAEILSFLPALLKRGLEVHYGSYLVNVEVLARSSTPRSKETGADGSQHWTWFEPMTATVLYNGPIFTAESADRNELNSWIVALNSAFLDGVVRRDMKTDCLQVSRPLRLKNLPDSKPSPHFMGIGLRSGQVVDCELRNRRVKWDHHFCTDVRLRLPLPLISALLLSPQTLQLVDVESFFNDERPLTIRAKAKDGNWHEHLYTPGMIFSQKGDDNSTYTEVRDSVDKVFDVPIDEDQDEQEYIPTMRQREKQRAPSTQSKTESVRSAEPPAVEWRASGRDFKEIKYFSHQSLGYKPGDWARVFKYLESKNQKTDIMKEMYSAHWLYANDQGTHPIVTKHHPAWTNSLKNEPMRAEFATRVSGRILSANPNLQINDEGCQAIAEKNEADFVKSEQKRKAQAVESFYGSSYAPGFQQGNFWSDTGYGSSYRGYGTGRGRGNPRGRRGNRLDFLNVPHSSTDQEPGSSNLGYQFTG